MTRQQEVLDMAFTQKRPPDIAQALNISRQTVHAYLSRARKRGIDIPEPKPKHTRQIDVVRLAQAGTPVIDIAETLNVKESYVRWAISQARKRGHIIPYQNKRRAAKEERIASMLTSDQKDALKIEAEARGMTMSALIREVISAVLHDDLIDAVLDIDRAGKAQ